MKFSGERATMILCFELGLVRLGQVHVRRMAVAQQGFELEG